MGETAATTAASLSELRASIGLLHGRVTCFDTTQKSLVAQLGLVADAVQEGARMRAVTARQLASLNQRFDHTLKAMERRQVLRDERGLPRTVRVGTTVPGAAVMMATETIRGVNGHGLSTAPPSRARLFAFVDTHGQTQKIGGHSRPVRYRRYSRHR